MQFQRTKNASRNFIFGLLTKIIVILGPFITRTIVILKLGAEFEGVGGLFTSIISTLSIADLGIGSAVVFCLYKPVAEDDNERICAFLALLRKLYLIIGSVILCVGLCVIPFLTKLIHSDIPVGVNIYLLYLLYLINTAIPYLTFSYKSVLFTVYQRSDITEKINFSFYIIKYVLQIACLFIFADYHIHILIMVLIDIGSVIFIGIKSNKFFQTLQPKGNIEKTDRKLFWNKAAYLSFHRISSQLINSADNIIISIYIGLTAITIYGNYNYIATSIFGFIAVIYNAIHAIMGNVLCTEDQDSKIRIFNSVLFGVTWVIIWCTICLFCLYNRFIGEVWLNEEFLLDSFTVLIICLFFFFNTMQHFYTSCCINVAGLWNKSLPRQIIAATVNFVLDIILGKYYGITGIVFASFVSTAFIGLPFDIFISYKYVLNANPYKGLLKVVITFMVLLVLGALTYFICSVIPSNGILGFIICGGICVIVPNAIIIALTFKTAEFKFIKEHIGVLLNKH